MPNEQASAYDQVTRNSVEALEKRVERLEELVELMRNRVQPWVVWTLTFASFILGAFFHWCLQHVQSAH